MGMIVTKELYEPSCPEVGGLSHPAPCVAPDMSDFISA